MNKTTINRDLAELTSDLPGLLAQLKVSGQPVVLSIAGQPEVILQDALSYQKMLDQIERFEAGAAVQEALAQASRGEGRAMNEFFEELAAEYRTTGEP